MLNNNNNNNHAKQICSVCESSNDADTLKIDFESWTGTLECEERLLENKHTQKKLCRVTWK